MSSVHIRIAVVVGADGDWLACGSKNMTDEEKMSFAGECFESYPQAEYFIEATLDLPVQKTVVGSTYRQDNDS